MEGLLSMGPTPSSFCPFCSILILVPSSVSGYCASMLAARRTLAIKHNGWIVQSGGIQWEGLSSMELPCLVFTLISCVPRPKTCDDCIVILGYVMYSPLIDLAEGI